MGHYHFLRHQSRPTTADVAAAKPLIIQKASMCPERGILTFIEKMLTIKVGSIMIIVITVSALTRMLTLLLTIEARASIREARTCE